MGILVQTSAPSAQPLSVTEAKAHARAAVDLTDEDDQYTLWIKRACELAELHTGTAAITQTWKLLLDRWDDEDYTRCSEFGQVVELWRAKAPVQSVSTVKYRSQTDGTLTTIGSSSYTLGAWGRLAPAFGEFWPQPRTQIEAIEITFVAGYGLTSASVPELLRQAMLLTVAHWAEHRGDENELQDMPVAAKSLLRGFWTGAF